MRSFYTSKYYKLGETSDTKQLLNKIQYIKEKIQILQNPSGRHYCHVVEKAPDKYEIRKEIRKEAQKIKYEQQKEYSRKLAEKEFIDKEEIKKEVENQAKKIKSNLEEQYLKQLKEKEEDNLKKEKLASELRDKVISLQDNLLEETSRAEYNHQRFLERKSKIDSIKVKLNNFINLPEGPDKQELFADIVGDIQSQSQIQQHPDDTSSIDIISDSESQAEMHDALGILAHLQLQDHIQEHLDDSSSIGVANNSELQAELQAQILGDLQQNSDSYERV